MHRQLLAFEHFPPPHTGAAISNHITRIIARNQFKQQFMGLTGDSASNNISATRSISQKLEESNIQWSYEENFFHCSAHVFNLVAEALCKPYVKKTKVNGVDTEVDDDHDMEGQGNNGGRMLSTLSKLSAMARIGNQSHVFYAEWQDHCRFHGLKPKKLITPAPTRWGSRYEQIDRAKEYRLVYQDMCSGSEKYAKYSLTDADWRLMDWLHKILGCLHICGKYVGVTKTPGIAFMIPCFSKLIDTLENEVPPVGLESAPEVRAREEAIKGALDKLNKYYIHTVTNPYFTFGMCMYLPHLMIEPLLTLSN